MFPNDLEKIYGNLLNIYGYFTDQSFIFMCKHIIMNSFRIFISAKRRRILMGKKILVVETGGTFATSSINNIRTLTNYGVDKTIYDYASVMDKCELYDIEFEKIRPIFTLSENMTLELINELLKALLAVNYDTYDGVIVTHGTDTLAYTSNILSMLFSHKGIPFVMVSSNHPLDNDKANGVDNFLAALDFIEKVKIQGVFVAYRDYEGVMEVHLGSRVKQMNQIIDSYESFKNVNFGKIENSEFIWNDNKLNPSIEQLNAAGTVKDPDKLDLTKTVMMIYPYVGLRHDLYNINENLDAVVYGVYHSGTFCSQESDPNHSINKLVDRLAEFNIPLYISEVSSESDKYASAMALNADKVVNIVYDTSIENLYSKVTMAFDLFDNIEERNKFIKETNVFFEKVV